MVEIGLVIISFQNPFFRQHREPYLVQGESALAQQVGSKEDDVDLADNSAEPTLLRL